MNKKNLVTRGKEKKKDKTKKASWVTPTIEQVSIEDDVSYPLVMQSNDSG